jgi:hypothetical protein
MRGSDLKRFKLAGSQAIKLAGCLAGKRESQDFFAARECRWTRITAHKISLTGYEIDRHIQSNSTFVYLRTSSVTPGFGDKADL